MTRTVRTPVSAALCLLAMLALPALARAATLTVINTNDSGPGSLRAAITTANMDGGDDTITFAVTGTIMLTAANGPLTITAPMTIQGPGAARLALDGGNTGGSIATTNTANGIQVLTISGGTADQPVAIVGLTIQHGGNADTIGGGLLNNGGTATITGCTFTGNSAFVGGGLANGSGSMTITGCTFTQNSAIFSSGGLFDGVGPMTITGCTFTGNTSRADGGGMEIDGPVTITDCAFTGNRAGAGGSGGGGGGLSIDGSTATVTGCTFTGNSAYVGGGLSNSGTTTITGCTFTDNSAPYGGGGLESSDLGLDGSVATVTLIGCVLTGNSASKGGGLANGSTISGNHGGTATLIDCALTGNTAAGVSGGGAGAPGGDGLGGGLYTTDFGSVTLTACALTGNRAVGGSGGGGIPEIPSGSGGTGAGGGLYVADGSTVTVTGCALTGNSAVGGTGGFGGDGLGGGLAAASGTHLTVTGCTLTANSAVGGNGGDGSSIGLAGSAAGGGLSNAGATTLTDDILYGDTGGEISGSSSVTASFCDIAGGYSGTGNFGAAPEFVSATAPYDLHLQSGSPCAGTGTASAPDYLPYDIDGRPRPTPGYSSPSIGAYEAAPTGPYSLVVENTTDAAPMSLRADVQCADDYPNAAITFDAVNGPFGSPQTITLTSGELLLNQPTSITGPAAGVAVDGNKSVRIFDVTAGTPAHPVALSGLTLQNGNAGGDTNGGGGLLNDGGAVALTRLRPHRQRRGPRRGPVRHRLRRGHAHRLHPHRQRRHPGRHRRRGRLRLRLPDADRLRVRRQ